MQHGELRSYRGPRLVSEFVLQFSSFNFNDTFKTGESSSYIFLKLVFFTNHNCVKWHETGAREDQSAIDSPPVPVSRSHVEEMIERRDPLFAANPGKRSQANQTFLKSNKEETPIERGDPLFADSGRAPLSSEIPEWLQEFRENFVDDRVPEHRDSHASSSHEASLEPTSKRSEDLGKHSVYIHFPKDRNCEICQRTKITRAPCRRRNGGAAPRAENFGDLITADHQVLSENCESRNNHRYAIVVEDLATQWIQSYPCKTKTSQETQRSLQKFLEPDRKPKVIYTDNSLEFGKVCEDLSLESLHVYTTQIGD